MYSHEIEELLKIRNYLVGGEDLKRITSVNDNPQINYIKYDAFDNSMEMTTTDNYHFKFGIIPYEEPKVLKKTIERETNNRNKIR